MARTRFAPTRADVRACVDDAAQRWAGVAHPTDVSFEELVAAHARILAAAEELSGGTEDAQKRAVTYFSIYEDSQGNFMFPLIASHGSMWGVTHTQRIDRALRQLRRFSRHGRVQGWMDALDAIRDINRRVFVEIYSTFYFTRFYGRHPRANEVIKPEVLALYNRVHEAVEAGEKMPLSERRDLYFEVFVHEQHDIVDPGIHDAVATCPSWMVSVFKRVRPRFKYFPRGESLVFTDFTDVDQRNREGLRAMDFGEQVGADRVLEALSEY
ncbi:MAG: hypothetical protein EP330_21530 [Deltaproteobacteria bacterium]|nr:MAG: hypothetical protein EP330_21530 [Deltaproteobacteria bacterium]